MKPMPRTSNPLLHEEKSFGCRCVADSSQKRLTDAFQNAAIESEAIRSQPRRVRQLRRDGEALKNKALFARDVTHLIAK
jgi:hypothetical protein